MSKYHYQEAPSGFYDAAEKLAEEWDVDPYSQTHVSVGFCLDGGADGVEAHNLGIASFLDLTPFSSCGCEGGPLVNLYDSIKQYIEDMSIDAKEEKELRAGISSALFDLAYMVSLNDQ